jgi:hypothetical protein
MRSLTASEVNAFLLEADSELLAWTTRIAARYMGHARAEEIGSLNAGEGHALIRVRVRRVVPQVELAVTSP